VVTFQFALLESEAHLRNEREAIESALRLSHGRISGPDGAARRFGTSGFDTGVPNQTTGIDKFSFR
jgi:hypothetical protein